MPLKFKWETEFKETEIGEIPKDWVASSLESLFFINLIPKGPSDFCRVAFISMENIPTDSPRPRFEIMSMDDIKSGNEVYPGSVLVAKITPSLEHGKMCITPEIPNLRWFTTTEVFSLVPKNNNDKKYFYYVLKHPTIRDILEGSMSGTSGRQRVETSAFKNLSVPFPLPAEQSRIATVLSWFDDLIENKKRQNEVLEKTAMAIFKSWFIDFEPFKDGEFVYNEELGKEIPKGWEVKPIGEIVKIESGGNAPQDEKYFIDASHRFVRVKHLTDGACVGESDFINEEAIKDYKLKLFKIGSVIFQKSGESIQAGRINFLPFDAFIVNHLAAVDNNKNNSNLDFIYCCLKQIYKELIEESSGTSLPYLRISDIQSKIVVLPPQTILLKFHSFVDPLFQKIITNQKQIIVLRKIRDTLLPLLVFGKLRVESV